MHLSSVGVTAMLGRPPSISQNATRPTIMTLVLASERGSRWNAHVGSAILYLIEFINVRNMLMQREGDTKGHPQFSMWCRFWVQPL